VCPPSLVLWENGIDANSSISSRSNSKTSAVSVEEGISGYTVLRGDVHRDCDDVSIACCTALKEGISSRSKFPDLTPGGTGTGTRTGIGFQPRNRLTLVTNGDLDRGTIPCTEGEIEGVDEEGDYLSNIDTVGREKFAVYEPEESDDASRYPAQCVQAVTTIIVDEGDMNPLKVRCLRCCLSYVFCPLSSVCCPVSAVLCCILCSVFSLHSCQAKSVFRL
jgi:hypothetical protein